MMPLHTNTPVNRGRLNSALERSPEPTPSVSPGGAIGASAEQEVALPSADAETERLTASTGEGRRAGLVRDAALLSRALDGISDVREALQEFEGRGLERELVAEWVLPELDWLEAALSLDTSVIEELMTTREKVWRAQTVLARATRAFERAGEFAVGGVIGGATWALLQAVPRPEWLPLIP